ncbi:MAG: MFS transporter [Candidatus Omnitrophota bacterium]
MAGFRDVLKNKNFFLLWMGQLISNFGDRLNQMALVALVYQSNPGSEVALAKLISFTIIPVFIIGPLAGVWVDRFNRKSIMVVSDILRGILVLSIPMFVMAKQILLVYLVIFLIFSISRFFIPSRMALIPDLVSKDKLLVANTLQDTTHMIGNVIGLMVAGVIVNIKYVGAIGGFYIDAASFFVSAFLIGMIVQKRLPVELDEDVKETKEVLGKAIRRSFFHEIKEGVGYLIKYSNMRFVIAVFALLMAGIGTISCVIIVFVQDAFGTATRDIGFLGVFLVAGLFLGTVLYGRFGQKIRKRKMVLWSFVAAGISIILFTLLVGKYPLIIVAGIAAGMIGAAVSPIMVSTNTLTQETIPPEARGRIFSSLEVVIHLAFLVFMFLAAYMAKYVDRFWILVMTGAVFSISGLGGILIDNKRQRAAIS